MNTKYKTAGLGSVPRSVGRPLVLPLGPRPLAPVGSRKGSSIEKRQIKRTPSTGSISSINSARSTFSESSRQGEKIHSGRKQKPQQKAEEDEDEFLIEQDIKFTDMDASQQSHRDSARSARSGGKKLGTDYILDLSQESDPYKVYEVDLHGEEVKQVPDLEKFRKLRVLDLSGNHIKKICGLDFNKDLRDLKLYDNEIKLIDGLENLKELCNLQLQHNQIATIGRGLGALKKLQILRLDSNKINKLETAELLSCCNITSLDLSNNRLENLSPLTYLSNLEELFAAGNRLTKIGDITKCRRLQEIDLSRNRISDLSGIANLPNVQILDVSHNQLKSIKSVGKLRSLEELNINANRISELSYFVSVFPKLQILFACDNMIARWDEICALSDLQDLVELFLSANPFTMEDGEMPTYHQHVTVALPSLEVIDGIMLKKPCGKPGAAPLMRPMSAASIISVRQVDSQLKAATQEQDSLQKSIADKFESLRTVFDSLPSEAPSQSSRRSLIGSPVDTSRCNSRARLREARNFAAAHFDSQNEDDDEEF